MRATNQAFDGRLYKQWVAWGTGGDVGGGAQT